MVRQTVDALVIGTGPYQHVGVGSIGRHIVKSGYASADGVGRHGAVSASASGALYASAFQYIVPDSVLTLEISVQMAIITMLGGAGTLLGPIVGAILLLGASELFKNRFQESHLLIYGILIVLVVLFLPDGIVGGLEHLFRRRKRPPAASIGTPAAAEAKGGN